MSKLAADLNVNCFDLYRWQNYPLAKTVDSPDYDSYIVRQKSFDSSIFLSHKACVLCSRRLAEDTYIFYGYLWKGKEYVFAWVTPFDEYHRALSKKESMFYDVLEQGFCFLIKVNPEFPKEHIVSARGLGKINKGVIYLDPKNG